MIYLQKVFDDLAYGEFANIKIGQSTLGTLNEKDYPRIVSAINLGLIELSKRFKLREKEVVLYPQTGVYHYYLREDYLGEVGGLSADSYLISSNEEDPFADDLVKVLEAYDDLGNEVYLNDDGYPDKGIFTPTFDAVKISEDCELEEIHLVYQAYMDPIVFSASFKPTTQKLYWPDFILDALLNYVAARVFTGKTSKAGEGSGDARSMTFYKKFEIACMNITNLGLVTEGSTPHKRFINNGWV